LDILYTRVYVYMPISINMDQRILTRVVNARNIIGTLIDDVVPDLFYNRMLSEAWKNLDEILKELDVE